MLNNRFHFGSLLTLIGAMFLLTIYAPPAHAQMGGGMGRGMSGMMLISGGRPYRADGTMLQMTDAIYLAQNYMQTTRSMNLIIDEIEEWEYNYYVVVKEPTPSTHKAFQLVIDKWTGLVMPEPGPNMIWNAKYCGVMGGTCGGGGGSTVTPAAATIEANNFLQQRLGRNRNLAVLTPPDLFYGYYTFDVKDVKTGAKYGMLSVKSTSGQVWYHTWHGKFIQGREF